MARHARSILVCFILLGCVEPIELVIKDKEPRLVVEGTISDRSYNETLLYPSDGRRFKVRLTYTNNVSNERVQPATYAAVSLVDDSGVITPYTEVGNGIYEITDPDFKAASGRAYKLTIRLSGDEIYESSWESLPPHEEEPMGEIRFYETEKKAYRHVAREIEVRTQKGIDVLVSIPTHNRNQATYSRWDYSAQWVFIAPLPPPFSDVKKCWVASPYYLSDYQVHVDHRGGYDAKLFFLETIGNERIFEDFTVLVRQKVISEGYYTFLKEMQEQNQGALRSDKPPFNLNTNITALNGGRPAIGYFAVMGEQAKRWYFNSEDLSYLVPNKLRESCQGPAPFVPPPGCWSCVEYQTGDATNVEPDWWRD